MISWDVARRRHPVQTVFMQTPVHASRGVLTIEEAEGSRKKTAYSLIGICGHGLPACSPLLGPHQQGRTQDFWRGGGVPRSAKEANKPNKPNKPNKFGCVCGGGGGDIQ